MLADMKKKAYQSTAEIIGKYFWSQIIPVIVVNERNEPKLDLKRLDLDDRRIHLKLDYLRSTNVKP